MPLALRPVNQTVTPFWERRLARSSAFTEPAHRTPISLRPLHTPQGRTPRPTLTGVEGDVGRHVLVPKKVNEQ